MSSDQLNIADFDNILLELSKNWCGKYVLHFENIQLYLRLGLKLKKLIVY